MSTFSWNPFPLSWKQRLAVSAWMLLLVSLPLPYWGNIAGIRCLFSVLSPNSTSGDFIFDDMLSIVLLIPLFPLFVSPFKAFRSSNIRLTLAIIAMFLSFAPFLFAQQIGIDPQSGFLVWWASAIVATLALGMRSTPREKNPFQFRLSTLLALSFLLPLCIYANLKLVDLDESTVATFSRQPGACFHSVSYPGVRRLGIVG